MKTIGLIGGITPLSTILYYQILNDLAAKKFSGVSSCKVLINSFNFAEISEHQAKGNWSVLDEMMAESGKSLESAGADCILICANTMHLCIDALRDAISIPVIHIATATAKQVQINKLDKVALLGTKYTMEKTFYTDILRTEGIETMIPLSEERDLIHDVIYKELAKGEINPSSKEKYLEIINRLVAEGAQGIILGCTEIPLLIDQSDVSVPIFDTTKIHAQSGFDFITS